MKVLMVEPGKSPYAAEIESGLKSLQAAVGGDIQAVYPYEDPVALMIMTVVFALMLLSVDWRMALLLFAGIIPGYILYQQFQKSMTRMC